MSLSRSVIKHWRLAGVSAVADCADSAGLDCWTEGANIIGRTTLEGAKVYFLAQYVLPQRLKWAGYRGARLDPTSSHVCQQSSCLNLAILQVFSEMSTSHLPCAAGAAVKLQLSEQKQTWIRGCLSASTQKAISGFWEHASVSTDCRAQAARSMFKCGMPGGIPEPEGQKQFLLDDLLRLSRRSDPLHQQQHIWGPPP